MNAFEARLHQIVTSSQDYTIQKKETRQKVDKTLYSFLEDERVLPYFLSAPPSRQDFSAGGCSLRAEQERQTVKNDEDGRCSHIFRCGESVYCCRDCGIEDVCFICADCFDAERHVGHDVTFTIQGNAPIACACGDKEAFKKDTQISCAKHSNSNTRNNKELPPELITIITEFITTTLDFCKDVWKAAPVNVTPPANAQAVFYETSVDELRNAPSTASIVGQGKGPWSVILWNDEKHSYAQVINQLRLADSTMSTVSALEAATRVDSYGREVICTTKDTQVTYRMAKIISAIDLAVNVRPSYDVFLETVTGKVVDFLNDLCQCSLGGDRSILRRIILEVLLRSPDEERPTRLEYILQSDKCLWKALRIGLRELYCRLLTLGGPERLNFAHNFMLCYPRLVDCYLFNDREPDHSAVHLSAYFYALPATAAALVDKRSTNNTLSMIIYLLYAFFTEQYERAQSGVAKGLSFPPDLGVRRIHPDGSSFKHKRYSHLFGDLCRLLGTVSVGEVVVASQFFLNRFAKFAALFNGMNTNKRETGQHVEYEQETWVAAFNLSMHVAKSCRAFGVAFQKATQAQVYDAVNSVLGPCLNAFPRWKDYHTVTFGGQSAEILKFSVADQAISFHHAPIWLLAEITKAVRSPPCSDGSTTFETWLEGILNLETQTPRAIMWIAEESLRVCALLAQIRAGLWVRNGFSIRAQQLHYRESTLREYAHEQDLHLLQFLLAVGDSPTNMFLQMLDRFDLVDWLNADNYSTPHKYLEPQQGYTIAEEFLALLTTLLGEPGCICAWSEDQLVRRDVCQALALGSASHSELVKRLPERTADSLLLDGLIAQVATYRPPQGPFDHGVYYLRDDAYDYASPYYLRYNRNQRDECAKAIRATRQRNAPSTNSDQPELPFIPPTAFDYSARPVLQNFPQAYESPVLVQIVANSLRRYLKDSSGLASEAFLDLALHLVVLGLVHSGRDFALACTLAVSPSESSEAVSAYLTQLLLTTIPDVLRPKCDWCLQQIKEHAPVPEQPLPLRLLSIGSPDLKAPGSRDEKRAAAKARQAAILAQFKTDSKAFFDAYESDEEEGDDMQTDGDQPKVSAGSCIVCQEDLNASDTFGALALIQSSRILQRQARIAKTNHFALDQDGPAPSTIPGMYASTCGHMMHVRCFETYCHSIEVRHLTHTTRNHPEDLSRREFICPLCKSLGNVLMPVALSTVLPTFDNPPDFDVWATDVAQSAQILRDNGAADTLSAALQLTDELPPPLARSTATYTDGAYEMLDRMYKVTWALREEASLMVVAEQIPTREVSYAATELLVGYTIAVWEAAARSNEAATFSIGMLEEKKVLVLDGLLESIRHAFDLHVGLYEQPWASPDDEQVAISRRATFLKALSADYFVKRDDGSIISNDVFAPLVGVAAVDPGSFRFAATSAFYAAVLQAARQILYRGFLQAVFVGVSEEDEETALALGRLGLQHVFKEAELHKNAQHLDVVSLGRHIISATLPFLKQTAILANQLSKDDRFGNVTSYTALLQGLHITLPTIVVQQESSQLRAAMRLWVEQQPETHEIPLPPKTGCYNLFDLPRRFDQVVQAASSTACRRCNTVPADPALCLICGTIVCNQSFCCMDREEDEPMYGECNTHMWSCGGSTGLYFLIKKCAIIYCYTNSGAFSNPPYLDAYGEVDLGHKRHTLQYLHTPRFDEVRRNWLEHAIPTIVARRLEATVDSGGWISL